MATQPNNPFTPAAKVAKKLKVLLYGLPGTGKTRAALTFPRVAVIDTEGGTDLYAGRPGIPDFAVLRAKTLEDVNAAIAFIKADGGKSFDTLVIDPITTLYDVQKEAASAKGKDGEMNPRLWNKVNTNMKNLYIALVNLPVHVVVIAAEAELYEGEGLNLKVTGNKPDADKRIQRPFDFVVRMKADHSAQVIKSRGVGLGKEIPAVNWDVFALAAGMFSDGQSVILQDDESAAEKDARVYADAPVDMLRLDDRDRWLNFLAWAKKTHKLEETDVMRALYKINGATFKQAPATQAKASVETWAASSVALMPSENSLRNKDAS